MNEYSLSIHTQLIIDIDVFPFPFFAPLRRHLALPLASFHDQLASLSQS